MKACTISLTYGDLVYIGNGSSGITVSGCVLTNSGRQGISVTRADGVTLDNNLLSQIRRTAFTLEPSGSGSSVAHVLITNNRIGVVRLGVVTGSGKGTVDHVAVVNNRLFGQPLTVRNTPPAGRRRQDWVVADNVSDTTLGSPHAVVWMIRTDGVSITGNTQPLAANRHPKQLDVELTDCTQVVVQRNNFPFK